jgi:hypothetical protein
MFAAIASPIAISAQNGDGCSVSSPAHLYVEDPSKIAPPDSAHAKIVFIGDPILCRAGGTQCRHPEVPALLTEHGTLLAVSRGFSYMEVNVKPGEHHLCAAIDAKGDEHSILNSYLTLSTTAGRTYFVRGRISISYEVKSYALELLLADDDDGAYLASRAKALTFKQ